MSIYTLAYALSTSTMHIFLDALDLDDFRFLGSRRYEVYQSDPTLARLLLLYSSTAHNLHT
jgi:hypothetical protein